jgi:hypothetical protein
MQTAKSAKRTHYRIVSIVGAFGAQNSTSQGRDGAGTFNLIENCNRWDSRRSLSVPSRRWWAERRTCSSRSGSWSSRTVGSESHPRPNHRPCKHPCGTLAEWRPGAAASWTHRSSFSPYVHGGRPLSSAARLAGPASSMSSDAPSAATCVAGRPVFRGHAARSRSPSATSLRLGAR